MLLTCYQIFKMVFICRIVYIYQSLHLESLVITHWSSQSTRENFPDLDTTTQRCILIRIRLVKKLTTNFLPHLRQEKVYVEMLGEIWMVFLPNYENENLKVVWIKPKK